MIFRSYFHPLFFGATNFLREGQYQGHEGEGKKDQEYHYTFGNRANDIDQDGVILTAKP